ncbi:hypothetical protein ASPACDRAFT_1855740 [Aspergillus aculeatus ATCC 16872]|uniref:ATP-grasp domain-containing protein n=1 Tax=Aspergillus aculeatus (strain ATCC 16872 / CBS 172.66 / WB 5094) TaxID=690307 RepID=A0A1L9WVH7_ASPA1|nr:uncharacterized protein ASPACDRAFT_1855740 [Aspergillus aculeatus ATCC 16872]OJK00144.1 hypothetical protein ASPACDRAFT_1855740 [Aspergillus aculeatus ATCC 16872]
MPLEPHEKDLLHWLHEQSEANNLRLFRDCQGHWRSDLLLPSNHPGTVKICEINARYSINAQHLAAYGYQIYEEMAAERGCVFAGADARKFIKSQLDIFDPKYPIHIVRDQYRTPFIDMFVSFAEQSGRISATIIKPADLRLIKNGERLDPFFLFTTKRILGVLLQELDGLVSKQVLTPDQAAILRHGVVPTINPGSPELSKLIGQQSRSLIHKDKYIIKPVRSGRGDGILLGRELSVSQWESLLLDLRDPDLEPGRTMYIIQPLIEQPLFELLDYRGEVQLQSPCRVLPPGQWQLHWPWILESRRHENLHSQQWRVLDAWGGFSSELILS